MNLITFTRFCHIHKWTIVLFETFIPSFSVITLYFSTLVYLFKIYNILFEILASGKAQKELKKAILIWKKQFQKHEFDPWIHDMPIKQKQKVEKSTSTMYIKQNGKF